MRQSLDISSGPNLRFEVETARDELLSLLDAALSMPDVTTFITKIHPDWGPIADILNGGGTVNVGGQIFLT